MPGFDRSGPDGAGPVTGWGRGRCTSRGMGMRSGGDFFGGVGRGGRSRGGGRGRCFGGGGSWWGRWFGRGPGVPAGSAEDEAAALKAELSAARQEIAAMESRLQELTKGKEEPI